MNDQPRPENRIDADIIPHPRWRARLIEDRLREAAAVQSAFRRRKMLSDAAREYRDRLVALGVRSDVIETNMAALVRAFGLGNTGGAGAVSVSA